MGWLMSDMALGSNSEDREFRNSGRYKQQKRNKTTAESVSV
jgi:hypothetical protein